MRGGVRVTTWKPGWNNSPTCTIRVPKVFKNQILRYARALDSNEDTSVETALRIVHEYLAVCETINNHKTKPNSSPRWYHFNKFKNWLSNHLN